MASVEFATILALGAALLAGIGYVTLQRSARQVTAEEYVGHFTLFHLSLRHALWWLGSLAAVASFTLQAIALTMGSVVLVQSLQATALLFALLIDARLTHHRCTPREWMWAVLLAGAVAVIVMSGNPAAGTTRAPFSTWAVVAVVVVPAVVLCVVGARIASGSLSAVLLAVASSATRRLARPPATTTAEASARSVEPGSRHTTRGSGSVSRTPRRAPSRPLWSAR